jgi:hypothetical protein
MRNLLTIDTCTTALPPAPPLHSVGDEAEVKALAALAARISDLAEELLACVAATEEQEMRWADLEIAYLLGCHPDERLAHAAGPESRDERRALPFTPSQPLTKGRRD